MNKDFSSFVDVDECLSEKTNNCNKNFGQCLNTIGSYKCLCNYPYNGDGIVCNGVLCYDYILYVH